MIKFCTNPKCKGRVNHEACRLYSKRVNVIYRISDKISRVNTRIPNATKQHCLMNAAEIFGCENFHIIADNCSDALVEFLKSQEFEFERTSLGNSKSFGYAVKKAVNDYSDDEIIYLLEDDYLHLPGGRELILEGIEIADYVTLYDTLDQYMTYTFKRGSAAPLNRFNIHTCRIFLTEHSHWREAPATTMTFAARVKTLREDYSILTKHLKRNVPLDFVMFTELTKNTSLIDALKLSFSARRACFSILKNNFAFFRKKRLLVSAIPGRSTHCGTSVITPLTDWTKV